ncbi:LysR substrate-binding domain-containing protein [Burkholderia pseudomallei]|uniref:LysR substrate-binding domain-containing protein n=1 Tax=Burkholderia pseudomallei TaxID=28450 RepID=UPI0005DE849F|nr:LysR substrate-binding domain-containing protein [Burkholderia pseudomallei]CAJ9895348.1 LysR family transcriptional regulator [Burkholderia pseudomallei]CFV69617.1 LysR family transcriptional regulator [Burkholderia pseudomallei]CPI57799.1 LysR family transcriptional regulator [Burkholderia pseudomallei]
MPKIYGSIMPPVSVRQLEAFRAVIMTGSVTAAGDLLHLTQPTVSKLIADLEHRTGLILFDRIRRRLVPRPEAYSLFQRVDKTFAALEEVGRDARRLALGHSGHLRIVAMPAFGLGVLPRAVGAFLRERPEVTVDFNIGASTYVAEWIANRQADVGFATATPVGPGVTLTSFVTLPGLCVLPAGHPLAERTEIRPRDLDGERFVSFARDSAFRHLIDDVFRTEGVARRIVIESGSAAAACALVAAGTGVAIVDPLSALDGWRAGGVVLARFKPDIPFVVDAVFPSQVTRSVLAAQFLEVVKATLQEMLADVDHACELRHTTAATT